MPVVAISTSSFGVHDRAPLATLERAGFEARLNPHGRRLTKDETREILAGAVGLVAGTETLDREVLESAPELRVISRCGSGLDSVDLVAAQAAGIPVLSTPGAPVAAVAELTLAGILDLLRQVSAADRRVRAGEWQKPMGRLLAGKRIGIVGLGRVGRRLVELLAPFEPTLLAHDPAPDNELAERHDIAYRELDEVLSEADIVTLHLPYSPATHHLLDRRRLALMRPGALLVNAARGGLVDESALYDSLERGHLGGAYLDVFEREPYDGPLLGLGNVILTPHIGSYAVETRVAMETEAVANLLLFFAAERGE